MHSRSIGNLHLIQHLISTQYHPFNIGVVCMHVQSVCLCFKYIHVIPSFNILTKHEDCKFKDSLERTLLYFVSKKKMSK